MARTDVTEDSLTAYVIDPVSKRYLLRQSGVFLGNFGDPSALLRKYRLPPNVQLITLSSNQKRWLASTSNFGGLGIPSGGPEIVQLVAGGWIDSSAWSDGYFVPKPLQEVLERYRDLYLG
ncbi:MAG: hypothetical protein WAM39_06015 [Bryobacteraceae bacterium]